LIPAAAQQALARFAKTTGAELEAVHARVRDYAAPRQPAAWELTEPQARFLRTLAEAVEPPHLDTTVLGKKVPPPELLEHHERIAFVGGSNHQLAAKLRQARDKRGGRPWRSIEVFFLTPEAMASLAHEGQSAAQWREVRTGAEAALRELLPACVERWALYEHALPLYFASYWDWDTLGGRIHVSTGVWGQDVAHTPSIDYVRVADPPSEPYTVYVKGLEALRKLARVLARSTS
jgi:hypothetical protein